MTRTQVKRLEKKGEQVPDILEVLMEETRNAEDWTRVEKIEFNYDLTKTASVDLLFPGGILSMLESTGIPPVTEIGGKNSVAWFFVIDCVVKKSRKGTPFLRVKVSDHMNVTTWLRIWGLSKPLKKYTLWMCEAKGDLEWGPSTGASKIKPIEV